MSLYNSSRYTPFTSPGYWTSRIQMCPDHPVLCRLGFTKYKEISQGYPRFFEKNVFRFPAGFHVRPELKEFTVKSGSRVFGACSDRDTLRLASLNPKPNLKNQPLNHEPRNPSTVHVQNMQLDAMSWRAGGSLNATASYWCLRHSLT